MMLLLALCTIDLVIALYCLYFLIEVRFYECIFNKMGKHIYLKSYGVVFLGSLASFLIPLNVRLYTLEFDYLAVFTVIFQFLALILCALLLLFHITTTSK